MLAPVWIVCVDIILLAVVRPHASQKDLSALEANDEWVSLVAQSSYLRLVITTFRMGYGKSYCFHLFNVLVVHVLLVHIFFAFPLESTRKFSEAHTRYTAKAFDAGLFSVHSKWTANSMPSITACFVLIFAGVSVQKGQMTVASFVVFMNTIQAFGPAVEASFEECFAIGKGYACIIKVAELLNQETRRQQLLRQQEGREKMIVAYKSSQGTVDWDPEALIIHNASLNFPETAWDDLPAITCHVDGGQIVALRGQGSAGKKCILRLLARHYVPTTGFIYFPARWRYRYGVTCS